MKKTATLIALAASAASASAALTQWQAEVGTGSAATTTEFSTVSAPTTIDVGALTGAMSFEFIVNASTAGVSQALIGDRDGLNNNQALKFEQYNNTGNYGITIFGGAGDWNSGVANTTDTDVHVLFTTNGTNLSTIYVNGVQVATSTNVIAISGVTGIGGVQRTSSFVDALDGDILGFASYDSELTSTEALVHSDAFAAAVPEPSSSALLGLGGLALILRRRK